MSTVESGLRLVGYLRSLIHLNGYFLVKSRLHPCVRSVSAFRPTQWAYRILEQYYRTKTIVCQQNRNGCLPAARTAAGKAALQDGFADRNERSPFELICRCFYNCRGGHLCSYRTSANNVHCFLNAHFHRSVYRHLFQNALHKVSLYGSRSRYKQVDCRGGHRVSLQDALPYRERHQSVVLRC